MPMFSKNIYKRKTFCPAMILQSDTQEIVKILIWNRQVSINQLSVLDFWLVVFRNSFVCLNACIPIVYGSLHMFFLYRTLKTYSRLCIYYARTTENDVLFSNPITLVLFYVSQIGHLWSILKNTFDSRIHLCRRHANYSLNIKSIIDFVKVFQRFDCKIFYLISLTIFLAIKDKFKYNFLAYSCRTCQW